VPPRFWVPAAAWAAALLAARAGSLWLFLGLTLTATLNQGFDLARALPREATVPGALTADLVALPLRTWRDLGALVGLLNVGLFGAACAALVRAARPADPAP
jgi:hypothetical protein